MAMQLKESPQTPERDCNKEEGLEAEKLSKFRVSSARPSLANKKNVLSAKISNRKEEETMAAAKNSKKREGMEREKKMAAAREDLRGKRGRTSNCGEFVALPGGRQEEPEKSEECQFQTGRKKERVHLGRSRQEGRG